MGLKDTIKSLRSQMEQAFAFDTHLESISTGSIAVDMVTGIKGFPRKRVSEVFGWESSGKTTLCLQACAHAQQSRMVAAYLDMERGVDLSLAAKIGFNYEDTSKGIFITPSTFEEAIRATYELCETGEVDLIVIDSIPAMVPQAEMEGEIEETGSLAHRARLLSAFLPRITKVIAERNVALVLVNQMRYRIATSKFDRGPSEQSSGGAALRFYSSLRLDMELVTRGNVKRKIVNPLNGKEEEVPCSNVHRASAFKSKVATPYRRAEFCIRYDPVADLWGVDNLQTIIDLAKARKLIEGAGSWFAYEGPSAFKVSGTDKLYTYLREHPDTIAEIRAELKV